MKRTKSIKISKRVFMNVLMMVVRDKLIIEVSSINVSLAKLLNSCRRKNYGNNLKKYIDYGIV